MPDALAARTIGDLVSAIAAELEDGGVPLAAREARDLVAALRDAPRFWPTLHATDAADPELVSRALAATRRRRQGAPFAYAVGRAAFRHLTLRVDERVLIPRQETELLVELVLERTNGGRGTAVDVGTGSGCIALALACEGGFDRVIATDVSHDALEVASANAAVLASACRAAVELRAGSFLAPVAEVAADLVVSNPPYISFAELGELPAGVRDWEPATALSCGGDGMKAIEAIVREAAPRLVAGGLLALEVDSRRADRAAAVARLDGRYARVDVVRDLAGRDRFVFATKSGT